MKVSFDFDGTLTVDKFQLLARVLLIGGTDVYILTNRFSSDMKEVYDLGESLGIKRENIFNTDNVNKFLFIQKNNLKFDLHFDDDYFDVDGINNHTDTIAVLISLASYPLDYEG